jgi:hypothetical protein
MRKIQYLPPNLVVKTLRLEAFEEVHGDPRILRPGCLQVSSHSSLAALA